MGRKNARPYLLNLCPNENIKHVERYIDTYLHTGGYEGIRFEDYSDQYKSFNMNLSPCDMEMYNSYYGTDHAEHQGSVSFRWIKGPDAKRPSTTSANGTKKQLNGALQGHKIISAQNIIQAQVCPEMPRKQ